MSDTNSPNWHYLDSGNNPVGPFDHGDLQRLRTAGVITDDTLVADGSGSDWLPFQTTMTPPNSVESDDQPKFLPPPLPPPTSASVAPSELRATTPVAEPAAPAARLWFVILNGERVGPLDEDGLLKLSAEKRLSVFTQVWSEGLPAWSQIRDLPGVFPPLIPQTAPQTGRTENPATTRPSSTPGKLALGALFLLMPYVAVPLFWILGCYAKTTRIILSIVGVVLTLWISISIHNDNLPQNVGKLEGKNDAVESAKNFDSMESALDMSRKARLERKSEIASNPDNRRLYVTAFDEAFRNSFPEARRNAVREAEETAKQAEKTKREEGARKMGWDVGFLDGNIANRSGFIKPSDDVVDAKARGFANTITGIADEDRPLVERGYESGFWDGWRSAH